MFAPQVAARGVPVAEFNMEDTPATMRFKYVSFTHNMVNVLALCPAIDDVSVFSFVLFQVPLPRPLRQHLTRRAGATRGRTKLKESWLSNAALFYWQKKKTMSKMKCFTGGGFIPFFLFLIM